MVAGDRDEMTRQEATSDGADADSYIKQSGVGWGEVGFGGLGALGGLSLRRLRWCGKLIFQVISEKEVTHRVMQRGRRFHGVRVRAVTHCSSSLHSVFPSYFPDS